MSDENAKVHKRKMPKYGFGMSPISDTMKARYDAAVKTTLRYIEGRVEPPDMILIHLSELKGMFNRCVRKDQWDWCSVHAGFGYPDRRNCRAIANLISQLRTCVKDENYEDAIKVREQLIKSNILGILRFYEENEQADLDTRLSFDQNESGWLYMLSQKQRPELLKIGITQREPFARTKEINASTGVAFPFSVRKVFRVKNARKVEKAIHDLLADFRIRPDREFFEIDFRDAVSRIEGYLEQRSLLCRCKGKVKWFSEEKGYGFISTDSDIDVFLHGSELGGNLNPSELSPGTEIEFDVVQDTKGPQAVNIQRVEL